MRFALATALLLSVATPAVADELTTAAPATASELHRNQTLFDAKKARLGAIDSITDASVGLIVDGSYVRVPVASITIVDGKATTSMAKKDLKAR